MANWFKIYETDLDETRMRYALTKLPEVWPVWTGILIECCRHSDSQIKWGSHEQELFGFSDKLKISIPKINLSINLLCEIAYIEKGDGVINVLKWNEKQNDYLQRKSRGYWDSRRITVNHSESHVEERRIDKKREEDKDAIGIYHKDSRIALHWLNEKSGVHYREVDFNLTLVSQRLGEPEVTIEGVKEMIEHQVAEWKNTEMQKYLRPKTLFAKSNFDSYYANRKSKIISRDSAKRFDRSAGTANEGVHEQYNLRAVQAARTLQDAQRPGVEPDA